MNQMIAKIWVASLLSVSCLSVCARAQDTCDQECVQATTVGKDVQSALQQANLTGLNGLVLKKAVLTLETGSTLTGGISINFIIFTIKHQTKKGDTITQQITWTNVPKPAGAQAPTSSLKDVLAKAIATSSAVANGVKALPLSEATITIKFVVDKDNGGSVSYKILGINLGPTVDFDKVSTNTLAVTRSKP